MQRVWFITGASSGFGRALAEAALKRCESVVATGRRTQALDQLCAGHESASLAITLDVTDEKQRVKAVDSALRRFGRIDVLANIAGRGSLGAAEEFSPEQLREQMEVNFLAAAEMTRGAADHARSEKRAHPAADQHRWLVGDPGLRSILRLEIRARRLERGA
jgi:NAD(P)-dependent dehydrogenase (short-subunit alcohol dehydrogenase family)